MMKKGDWLCPDCGYHNFASRNECVDCKCYKPKTVTRKKGDWDCSCGALNFASRFACHKCGKNKENKETKENPKIIIKPGDWVCSCNEINFGTRVICYKCAKPKENINIKEEPCVVCMDKEREICIKSCGHLAYCQECASKMQECPICRV